MNSQSVFLSRKQRAPLRFASPVSDLGVAVEFRGLSPPFFWLWEGWGCKEREGEVKELHSYEQVQCWAKRRMMDWALSGLQLVFGGNKWSGRHAEYTTLATETPMLEHLGNQFRGKPHANCWPKLSGRAWTLIKLQIFLLETYLCMF